MPLPILAKISSEIQYHEQEALQPHVFEKFPIFTSHFLTSDLLLVQNGWKNETSVF